MDIKEEINIFLNQLCSELGICDPLYKLEYLLSKEYYEVDNFVREIFQIEELNPEFNLSLV